MDKFENHLIDFLRGDKRTKIVIESNGKDIFVFRKGVEYAEEVFVEFYDTESSLINLTGKLCTLVGIFPGFYKVSWKSEFWYLIKEDARVDQRFQPSNAMTMMRESRNPIDNFMQS